MTGDAPVTTAASPMVQSFVETTFERFEAAFAHGGQGTERTLSLAGRAVALRFAGPALARRLLPAIHHLVVPPEVPTLTVCAWDGASAPVDLPDPPWPRRDFLRQGRIRGHIAGPLVATFVGGPQLFQLYDRNRRRAIFRVGDASQLPWWHERSPFLMQWRLWAHDHGLALLHGSTVAENGRAVTLAGSSGAGKSTSALTCALAGMDLLGDDACVVDPRAPERVYSIYGRAKLETDSAARLGGTEALRALGAVSRHETATVVSPARVGADADLVAILLISVSGQHASRLSDVLAPGVAANLLVETVREKRTGLTAAAEATVRAVAESVPVRRLAAGTDTTDLVATIRSALA